MKSFVVEQEIQSDNVFKRIMGMSSIQSNLHAIKLLSLPKVGYYSVIYIQFAGKRKPINFHIQPWQSFSVFTCDTFISWHYRRILIQASKFLPKIFPISFLALPPYVVIKQSNPLRDMLYLFYACRSDWESTAINNVFVVLKALFS